MYYANKASKQQKKMAEFQRKQADLQAARQRRDLVRQNRIDRSKVLLTGEAQNASTTSGSMGGIDSIVAQGRGNLSFLDTMNTLSDQASVAYGRSIGYSNTSNMFGGLASLAMSFYNPEPTRPDQAQNTGGGKKTGAPIKYKGTHPTQSMNVGPGIIH